VTTRPAYTRQAISDGRTAAPRRDIVSETRFGTQARHVDLHRTSNVLTQWVARCGWHPRGAGCDSDLIIAHITSWLCRAGRGPSPAGKSPTTTAIGRSLISAAGRRVAIIWLTGLDPPISITRVGPPSGTRGVATGIHCAICAKNQSTDLY